MSEISVLTPVYNVERYLEQCMDSLIGQTFKDVQFICIDDGSTDSSGEILDRYARYDKRIQVIHKENTGYGKTMNVGLDCADGKYIAIVESDDFAEPDMLERMYRAAEDSQAEITKADHYNYTGGEDHLCGWLTDFPCGQVFKTAEHPQILEKANTIWSCLFRHDFLRRHNIRFHETPGAAYQDVSFAMQTWLWAERICFTDGAFLHYRNDNPDSSMHNPDKIFCTFEEFEWLEGMFAGFWEKNAVLERYFIASKYHDYLSNYNRIAAQYQYAFLLRLHRELMEDMGRGRICQEAFRQNDYLQLMRIKSDMHQFFKETGKLKEDLRRKFCSFENEEAYVEGFINYLRKAPAVILYGAGKVGSMAADFCLKNGIHPNYFAVTKKEKDSHMGIPVMEISELAKLNDSAAVVIAVSDQLQYSIYQNLQKYGFRHIMEIDEMIKRHIRQ